MKLYRILHDGLARWASEDGSDLRLLDGDPFSGTRPRAEVVPLATARLLPPVQPSKIVAIGLNYKDHAKERGKPVPTEPLLFLKPPSAIIAHAETIRRPDWAGRVDHEAELALVIGRSAYDLPSPEVAAAHILGATCANDVTARELQDRDVQFTRAKGFDTFCPLGPCLVTDLDLGNLGVEGRVNGVVKQKSRTDQLVFDPAYLVWYVSRVMTLLPGDIILTGTPAGIGPLVPGDVVEVEIEGLGVLRNPVA